LLYASVATCRHHNGRIDSARIEPEWMVGAGSPAKALERFFAGKHAPSVEDTIRAESVPFV
jgi:hypothetical protein